MPKELFGQVRVRRHPKGGGVYVYIPEALLAGVKVPRDHETLLVTRYATKSGEVILRFAPEEVTEWKMSHEYVTRSRTKAPPEAEAKPSES